MHFFRNRSIVYILLLIINIFMLFCVGCNSTEDVEDNVKITVLDRFTGKRVENCQIEFFYLNSDGSTRKDVLASVTSNKEGEAFAKLDKGSYQVKALGGWIGSAEFSLSKDDQEIVVRIYVFQITN